MSQPSRQRVLIMGAAGRDFHDFNLAYHCGTAITLSGNGEDKGGQLVVTKVTDLKSLFGKKPGTQKG